MKDKTVDMTRGKIMPQLIRFAIPVLIGALFQRVYYFADTYIVGKYLGDEALAAVSIAGCGSFLIFSIMMGLTSGVSVVIAQYYGAGDEVKVRQTFASSIYVMVWCTAIITLVGVIGAKPLLKIMQTSDVLFSDAYTYLLVMFIGAFGTMLYNWIASVMRALGNSVVPLLFLLVSSVLNILLDIVFVGIIPMGVGGAAFATVLAQVISGVLCLVYAWRALPMIRMKRTEMVCDSYIAKMILRYGIPTGLQMSIISISDMTLQSKINTYGTDLVVAYGVCMKVEGLGWDISTSIGTAVGTFVGQNIGAGDFERVRKGVQSAYLVNLVCFLGFIPAVWMFAEKIMKMFTENTQSIQYGIEYMQIFSAFFLAGGFLGIYHNMLRSAGDVFITVMMGVSEVVVRIGLTFLLAMVFGYYGLWWVSPITWVCATMVGAIRYYSGTWKKKAQSLIVQEAVHE